MNKKLNQEVNKMRKKKHCTTKIGIETLTRQILGEGCRIRGCECQEFQGFTEQKTQN